MQVNLAENIKKLRKEHSMTQEQVADALGVTVGAVYKWEAGLSLPEIRLLLEIADLFETSVDALLGYEHRSGNADSLINRIRICLAEKDFEGAVSESEKALKKYPNHFRLVYTCAFMYMVMTTEDKSRKSMARSNELFEKALGLMDRESSGDINEVTIKNYIATNYLSVGETEKALEIFKENNIHNINSSLISYLYAIELDRPDESLKYAKKTIIDTVISLSRTIYGVSFSYASRNDRACITSLKWLESFLDTLKTDPEEMVYTDKFKILSLALCAVWEEKFGCHDDAQKDIEEAYRLAQRFDEAPVFDAHGIRFIDDPEGKMIDSFGKDISEAVEKYVFDLVPKNNATKKIRKRWDELGSGQQ